MRARSRLLAVLVCVVAMVLSSAPAARAAARPKPYRPGPTQQIAPVPTRDVPPAPVPTAAAMRLTHAPVWPAAGSSVVTLPPARTAVDGLPGPVRAPGLAVSVSPLAGSPRQARVTVFDRARAKTAGVDGVLARIESADGTGVAGTVGVTVDYSPFAGAYGADWSTRLRLARLPECALTTPANPACAAMPLRSRIDTAARTVSAVVPVGALVATESASSGGAGDYSATKLQPASSWAAGANTGDFTWSYPMRVPPGVGGPEPAITLSYSAQSVDGMTAASNNQPDWAGAGFDLSPGGFIERAYKGCGDDMTGGNNATATGDLCWATDNATLSLAGHSGELLYNAAEGRWHLRSDDGTRIERRTGATNGDNDGEWWVVTTTDGQQYWFGRNRLPGWASGNSETASVFTEPVFGNHTGEPCHQATFAASSCTQAWRWNLDYVIDMNGNSMSLWYATATNKYALNLQTTSPVSYIRDGWLTKIEYGTQSTKDLVTDPTQATAADSIFSAAAPTEVEFVPDDRCLSGCATHDAAHWSDVPWDQDCAGSTCSVTSPTFWSTKRLKQVITKVRNGAAYRTVETWTLTHSYPDPGDGTRAGLWLDSLAHTGGSDSVPAVTFDKAQKSNRVDPDAPDGRPAMNWFRVYQIHTETGATISITYSSPDCVVGSKMPSTSALENNTYRCYPVWWTPAGATQPILEFFHKYVVTTMRENDNTGGAPPMGSPEVERTYTYPADAAAWHYTDDNGLVKDQYKTYSVWRGYPWVGVTTGKPTEVRQYVQTSFFRGMNGDRLPSGTRSVSLAAVDLNGDGDTTDAADAPAVNDEDAFAGQTRSSVTYLGPTGTEVSSTVSQPWRSAPTATRTINGVTVEARFVGVEATHQRVGLDHAPTWRTTSTHTEFDGYGMPVKEDDFGDEGLTTDDRCTTTAYKRNTTAWVLTPVKEVTTFALTCAAAANPATLTEADVISNIRTSYDGLAWDVTPTKGQPTQVATANSWTAGSPTDQAITRTSYDAQGRVTESYDALNRKTTTGYTPASGGPLTQTVTTQPYPFLFTTTNTIDPGYGVPTASVDVNGRRTDVTYDGLGRRTAVWLPGRDKATQTANVIYAYQVRNTAPSVASTQTLNATGGYTTSYALMDGLMRPRQTQAASPGGGRIITDTFYDTAGRVLRTHGAYYDNRGGPSDTLVVPIDRHTVPDQTYTLYDGAGRATDVVFDPYNNGERWRTHTGYTGDRTDITPPAGGTTTATFTDARGNTTALWQYGYPTAADHVTTAYTYNRKNQLSRVTDAPGNYWEYTYWLAGQVKTTRSPDASALTTTTYDKAGQLTSTQGPPGTLTYTYDELGRRTAMYLGTATPANLRATWSYDSALFDGTSTPALGRPAGSSRLTNGGSVAYSTAVRGYDDAYRSTGTTITIPASETGLAGSYEYQTTYRPDGSLDTQLYPSGGSDLTDEATTVGYEPVLGLPYQLTALDETNEYSYVSATTYDNLARVTQYTLYNGLFSGTGSRAWVAFTRENDTGRLTSIQTSRETGTPNVLANLGYTYDNAGNITKIVDGAAGDAQCFSHDALRRLTEAWTPSTMTCGTPSTAGLGGPAKYWTTWTINAIGNRIQQVQHATSVGGSTTTTDYTYPAAGAIQPHTVTATTNPAGTYRYDAAGNTTCRPAATGNTCPPSGSTGSQTLTWDPEGHVATSIDTTGTTSYVYDADGNRLLRTDPTGKTLYLPGQEIRYTTATGARTATRYYAFNNTTIGSRTAAGLTWLSADHQGTADVAIAANGQAATVRRQTPFGMPRGTPVTWPNPRGFVGGTVDNTGTTHLGAREYDSALGKFVSSDPLFNKDDPQSINGYGYANNTPVTMRDPDGTCVLDEDTGRCFRPSNTTTGAGGTPKPATRTGGGSGGCFGGDRQTGACLPGNGGTNGGTNGGGSGGCFGGDRQTGACLPGNGGTNGGTNGGGGGCIGSTPSGRSVSCLKWQGTGSSPAVPAWDTHVVQVCVVARIGLFLGMIGADICYGNVSQHGDFFTFSVHRDFGFAGKPSKNLFKEPLGTFLGGGFKWADDDPPNLTGDGKTSEYAAADVIGGGYQRTDYGYGHVSQAAFVGAGGYAEWLSDADTTTCYFPLSEPFNRHC